MDRLAANRYGLLHEPSVRQLQLLESAWTVRGFPSAFPTFHSLGLEGRVVL